MKKETSYRMAQARIHPFNEKQNLSREKIYCGKNTKTYKAFFKLLMYHPSHKTFI